MQFDEHTSIGGESRTFQNTHWSIVEKIKADYAPCNKELVGELLGHYWKPVYCYLQRKGHNNEQAKDLTQGFFQEVVLGRKLVQQADHSKGRFRTFLLTALNRYLTSEYRKQTAQKRTPADTIFPQEADLPEPLEGLVSEDLFNYAWVSQLLDRILEEVRSECNKHGLEIHWKVFRDRVLQPIMDCHEPPSMTEICERYKIDGPVKASNMIVAVKRHFQTALRRHLRQSVESENEVNIEIRELMKFLAKKAQ